MTATSSKGGRFRSSIPTYTSAKWRLVDPYGQIVFSSTISSGDQEFGATQPAGVGTLTLSSTGTYTLLIEGSLYDQIPISYEINAQPEIVAPAATLTPANSPLVSGLIETAGAVHQYEFTLASRTRLYFDSLTNSNQLHWSLTGPDGTVVDQRSLNGDTTLRTGYEFATVEDPDPLLDLAAGNYTLTVAAYDGHTGQYEFRLVELAGAAEALLSSSKTGTLDRPNETDVYSFTATAGDQYTFDLQTWNGSGSARWQLIDRFGYVVFDSGLTTDHTSVALAAGGTYYLLVEGAVGDTTAAPSYTFERQYLGNTPPPTLTNSPEWVFNQPMSGELTTSTPQVDYVFELAGESQLYFDALTSNSNLYWKLTGPAGEVVNRSFTASDGTAVSDQDAILKLPAGQYQLSIFSSNGATGAYAFTMHDLAAAAALPLVGATYEKSSDLSPANQSDVHSFTAPAGERVFVRLIAQSGVDFSPVGWRVVSPGGRVLLAHNEGSTEGGAVADSFVAPASGTYRIVVEGEIYNTGDPVSYTLVVNRRL